MRRVAPLPLQHPATFQFTHPGRGATGYCFYLCAIIRCFNSRTPGGVRLADGTLPADSPRVSIHAPREGCDSFKILTTSAKQSFNSRTPGGVRHATTPSIFVSTGFNSRTPGGVRLYLLGLASGVYVSIHAPREGCDRSSQTIISKLSCFNSRTPGGVRRSCLAKPSNTHDVSIHAPREGCDVSLSAYDRDGLFQFTHPGRGATCNSCQIEPSVWFQFTHPGRGATRP